MTHRDDAAPAPLPSSAPERLDLATVRRRLATAGGETRYWRTLEELAETPEFEEMLHREFPRQAAELPEGFDRRKFLSLSAATLALGGLAACTRQPQESLVPYVRQPEDVVPGTPLFFASAATHGGYAAGLLVESHEGRPTKVEGNPDHPASLGATDAFAQASVLGLYDPDRAQVYSRLGEIRSWDAFCDELDGALKAQAALQGAGLRILTQTVTSPTLEEQLGAVLAKYPKAKRVAWEPAGRHSERAAALAAFGKPAEVRYDLAKADVVLTLDGDLLAEGPGALRYARQFADRRRVKEDGPAPARLYSVESMPTCTGTLADHRVPLSPARVARFARLLAAELGVAPGGTPFAPGEKAARALSAVARDLKATGGRCLVHAGPSCAPEVHVLVHAINASLGAVGTTVFTSAPVEFDPQDQPAAIAELVGEMRAGTVDLLLILGGNPAFDAPADLDFAGAMKKVPLSAHLSLHDDETSERCRWQLPAAHELESWSDARAFDGTVSLLQPLILPLYGGRSAHELLAAALGDRTASGYDVVRSSWRKRLGAGFEAAWRRALHDGVVAGTALAPAAMPLLAGGAAKAAAALDAAKPGAFELALRPDPTVHDGRHANNGWLQELPKPITKLTWDAALHLSPATAEQNGLATGDVVVVAASGRSAEAPVFVLPGHADGCGTLHYGYGRRRGGRIAAGTGFDAYPLRTRTALANVPDAKLTKTSKKHDLVTTQHQFHVEGRNVLRTGTLETFRNDPEFARKLGEAPPRELTLYPNYDYSQGYRWGLSVDLNVCTSCSACVVACQAENNIPVVGKDQVSRGRAMHWLRIDRYFEGDPNDPALFNQPVACMHCENAPCEVVCPVAATSHSDEGLNVMTYNRCVGTKYCSNNCPYKVRRFNFLQYSDTTTPSLKMLRNPDVTVRNLGVMEKCTYCVQRISRARIVAEREGRRIRDGEIRTACQQACPTEAIVFGDMNDKASKVAALKAEPLSYGMLEDVNTRPRTSYLARVTNPNPELAGGAPPRPLAGERS